MFCLWNLVIAGVILAITLFVHCHTTSDGKYLPCPIGGVGVVALISLIPILNVLAFIGGAIGYFFWFLEEDWSHYDKREFKAPKCIKNIFKFLLKDVRG